MRKDEIVSLPPTSFWVGKRAIFRNVLKNLNLC
jgi:hypothetical protein